MIFLWSAVVIVTQPWHRSLALRWREAVWKPSINSKGIQWQEGGNSKDRKGFWADSKDIIEITQVPRRKINSCPNLLRMPTRSRRRILLQTSTELRMSFCDVVFFLLKRCVALEGHRKDGWTSTQCPGALTCCHMLPMLPWMFIFASKLRSGCWDDFRPRACWTRFVLKTSRPSLTSWPASSWWKQRSSSGWFESSSRRLGRKQDLSSKKGVLRSVFYSKNVENRSVWQALADDHYCNLTETRPVSDRSFWGQVLGASRKLEAKPMRTWSLLWKLLVLQCCLTCFKM